MFNSYNICLYPAVVVLVTQEVEEAVATLIIQIMAVQEVVVVAAATTIIIDLEVVVHIEDLAGTTEEVVDLGLAIHHQLVVMAT